MRIANLATFPPRQNAMLQTVARLSPQVDRVNVVLNEYDYVPDNLMYFENVVAIIPDHDTKDTGKFLPDVQGAEWVLFCDDDICYPADYVQYAIDHMTRLGRDDVVGGFHASTYHRPKLFHSRLSEYRKARRDKTAPAFSFRRTYRFSQGSTEPLVVDQLGTGVLIVPGDKVPPYDAMATAQKFVDVRFAGWCYERKILQVCLPREAGYLDSITFEDGIYQSFTRRSPKHVLDEIARYALKNPLAGTPLTAATPSLSTETARGDHHG